MNTYKARKDRLATALRKKGVDESKIGEYTSKVKKKLGKPSMASGMMAKTNSMLSKAKTSLNQALLGSSYPTEKPAKKKMTGFGKKLLSMYKK